MGPSAVNDILNNPRFQGAIDSITGLTNICDGIFAAFISFVGFFIISAALLRNVIAGAYAAYPKLFDMVADAKEAGIGKMEGQKMGSLAIFLLKLIPDFKSMSDFHDNTVEPKHYFIKAIPKMIGVVMIGVVIWNGYYRDTVSVAAGFGSELISRAVLSIDPVVWFDKLTNMSSDPTWATDGDNTTKGKIIKSVSKDVYGSIVSFYTDITTEQAKNQLGRKVEEYITQELNQYVSYLDDQKYDIKYQVTRVLGQPSLEGINGQIVGNETTQAFAKSVADFGIDSLQHKDEQWYERVILRFTKKAQGVKSVNSISNAILTVPQSAIVESSGPVLNIPLPQSINGCALQIIGNSTKVGAYSASIAGGKLILTGASNEDKDKTLQVVGSLFYQINNKTIQVGSIVLSGAGDMSAINYSFKDTTGSSEGFTWGQEPKAPTHN